MSSTEYIYGRNAVLAFLKEQPDRMGKIYLKQQTQGRPVSEIEQLASASRVPVQRVPGSRLAALVGPVNDQGVVAAVSPIAYVELEDWLEDCNMQDHPFLLVADEIEDPHNLGAMIRTAAAAGAAGLLMAKHRQVPVTGAVMKASAGTLFRIPLLRAGNLNQAVRKLKEAGFWICGTDMQAHASFWEQDYTMPLALITGGEQKGIRQKTRELCDFLVHIPMEPGVESLNASVSAALLCYEIRRQRSR